MLWSDQIDAESDVIVMNVGGVCHMSHRKTLMHSPYLRTLLKKTDATTIFLDRDGTVFSYVVNYLRGQFFLGDENTGLLKMLLCEAKHFQLPEMEQQVREHMQKSAEKESIFTRD